MIWGYASPWYGEFLEMDPDGLYARLKFLRANGLQVTGIGLRQVAEMSDAERDRLGEFLAENDLCLSAHVGFDYLNATRDEAQRRADEVAGALDSYGELMRVPICTTGARAGHRFDRTMPLEQKLERLSRSLAPLAAACWEAGAPLGIENHGDYYCSDWVTLCDNTPHLNIFLDTGNTYLIGERPLPAFEAAAPYTIGTHFKDHHVCPRPRARPLHFEVSGSVLGEGDVMLRECYDLLLKHAPKPEDLVMEIEMICPRGMDKMECMNRTLDFIRSLPEATE